MKKILVSIFFIALLAAAVFAHEEDEIMEGKELVDSKVDCNTLNDNQLEAIGEYLMEQMHPGSQHDLMHQMMGINEDTPEHTAVHVRIARMIYCGQGHGMMGMMGFRTGGVDMDGMMGGTMWGIGSILWILIAIGLILLVWLWVIKLWKELFR